VLLAETPVRKIEGKPGAFRLVTSRGAMAAREVVIGTNGYTGALTPWQRRRLVPLGSYIIATEPIGKARVESMFRRFCTMSNTQRVLFYYRPSPDHERVLFGGRASFRMTDAVSSAPTLYEYMCRVYPELRGVKLTHSWTGNVAFTFDYLPHMGIHEGLHYCMGCNGSGVAMMSYLGRQVALKILGRTNRACAFERIAFPTRPLYDGTPWFLPIVGGWYRLLDRLDRAFDW
jgi:glycine/D-amino acid oxidase-like deaminating enzyme